MKMRVLLPVALVAGSLLNSTGSLRAKNEFTPEHRDGGKPCPAGSPPTCPPRTEHEDDSAYFASTASTSERVIMVHILPV